MLIENAEEMPILSPVKASNPMETVGLLHNEALDYLSSRIGRREKPNLETIAKVVREFIVS